MYTEFYGFREVPFNVTPDPRFLYLNPCYEEALAALTYGIDARKGFVTLVGEAGTGKTTLLRRVLDTLGPRTCSVLLLNPTVTFDDILDFILQELGIPIESDGRLVRFRRLNEFLIEHTRSGGNVALLIDEAQDLSVAVLEELRLLSNLETAREKILQVVLAGQPELDVMLHDPRLRQLRQRITLPVRLRRLAPAEVGEYLRARLEHVGAAGLGPFAPGAVDRIAALSEGVPRVVNVLSDAALLVGFALGAQRVSEAIVDEAWREYGPWMGSADLAVAAPPLVEAAAPEVARPPAAPAADAATVPPAPPPTALAEDPAPEATPPPAAMAEGVATKRPRTTSRKRAKRRPRRLSPTPASLSEAPPLEATQSSAILAVEVKTELPSPLTEAPPPEATPPAATPAVDATAEMPSPPPARPVAPPALAPTPHEPIETLEELEVVAALESAEPVVDVSVAPPWSAEKDGEGLIALLPLAEQDGEASAAAAVPPEQDRGVPVAAAAPRRTVVEPALATVAVVALTICLAHLFLPSAKGQATGGSAVALASALPAEDAAEAVPVSDAAALIERARRALEARDIKQLEALYEADQNQDSHRGRDTLASLYHTPLSSLAAASYNLGHLTMVLQGTRTEVRAPFVLSYRRRDGARREVRGDAEWTLEQSGGRPLIVADSYRIKTPDSARRTGTRGGGVPSASIRRCEDRTSGPSVSQDSRAIREEIDDTRP